VVDKKGKQAFLIYIKISNTALHKIEVAHPGFFKAYPGHVAKELLPSITMTERSM
jgi:hypothetical protein